MSEQHKMVILDGNEAAASVAYRLSEVVAIYPITPSSPMAEWADQWLSEGKKNIWGALPIVEELQSEGGAAGALHGALQAGAFGTTFTASQGLLLMIPNMYKIAGELTPATMHVTARTLATHALSIFGDHSDVMACRATGWAMLSSNSVQEAADLALVAQIATLESRIPFMHFFDGFRTSHEVAKIEPISDQTIRAMLDDKYLIEYRQRALSPDRPVLRGSAQNPDVFFQAREACTPYHAAVPGIVQSVMDRLAGLIGRAYHIFDYYGAPDAERVIVAMGSGAETVEETVAALNRQGEKVGVLKVRLYRPFDSMAFLAALPRTVKEIAVLDRCKEPGAGGEPLYKDVLSVLAENAASLPFASTPKVIGGRYGLSSKEFTPAMAKGIFDELKKPEPKNSYTIGIDDDVMHSSLSYDPEFSTEDPKTVRALFYGLGSDGTVGANKNSIKIIGSETPNYAQGYFVYDSKKSGSMTTSHLRFGPNPIHSSYLITQASFVACHNFSFTEKMNVLEAAMPGAVFLLNSPYPASDVWDKLPKSIQQEMIRKKIEFYVIDGYEVARDAGMGTRINTIMQTCFFAISGVLPREEAIAQIKKSIYKTYGKRGEAVVNKNYAAVDAALAHLHKVELPSAASSTMELIPSISPAAPEFVRNVLGEIAAGRGDQVPVSAIPAGGTFPTGTSQYEKRNIAQFIPVWDKDVCIQCGKCVMVCPHAVIRSKIYSAELGANAPETFKWARPKWRGMEEERYTLQVAPEDCTGCAVCVEVCPAKNKSDASKKAINMEFQAPLRKTERENWEFFLSIPEVDRTRISHTQVKDLQLLRPLFEFSGACAGCGETAYIKLLTQLFGDRLYVGNATGCTSIYSGNLPTTPYAYNADGRGPTWSNSLFEDNAEFGFGMRLAIDQQKAFAELLATRLASVIGDELVKELLSAPQNTEPEIEKQRERVRLLRERLAGSQTSDAHQLQAIADMLVRKSVWILGGDGWAYDIGFGGLDHVLGSGKNVNVLVLDTEVYSNTGGQASKSTPRGAVAKFAASGKTVSKKDLAMEAVSYGSVYVARVALGGNDAHVIKAFQEAEAYPGTSIIIAYASCIAHGYDLVHSLEQQKLAVQSGYWPLMRYNPELRMEGKNPFQLDSKAPAISLKEYAYREARYTMLARSNPELAAKLLASAQDDVERQWRVYSSRAAMPSRSETPNIAPAEKKEENPTAGPAGGAK
jgi:pyruvate-ferredoxin/flavodoxin oxidoreductase